MTGEPRFRDDLYRGTAVDYDRHRLPYPAPLIDDLCRRTAPKGDGRLLDLACGPGTATFALCDRFAEVWAVDLEPEAVALAADKAARLGVTNVRWIAGRAEDVDADEDFDMVTIGTAFHRLDRPRVASLVAGWLRPGGHLALLWSSTPMHGDLPWQAEMAQLAREWIARLDGPDRLPSGFVEHLDAQPHTRVLEDAGLEVVTRHEIVEPHDWDVDGIVGFAHSTSIFSRAALGEQASAFERDVRERLLAVEPSGTFHEEATFAYDLARAKG